jgi:hypothetical protein
VAVLDEATLAEYKERFLLLNDVLDNIFKSVATIPCCLDADSMYVESSALFFNIC